MFEQWASVPRDIKVRYLSFSLRCVNDFMRVYIEFGRSWLIGSYVIYIISSLHFSNYSVHVVIYVELYTLALNK